VWPATFGLARCAIELFSAGGLRHDLAKFGVERASAISRQADLLLVAGPSARKWRRCGGRSMTQIAEPKWVISMGLRRLPLAVNRRHQPARDSTP
jgi:NADH-quinone oxidoreductase subunit B